MKLIAGLGNPGKEYEKTRHNVGFRLADRLAVRLVGRMVSSGVLFKRRYSGSVAEATLPNGEDVVLLKPKTFMNLSGRSVSKAIHELGLKVEDVLVIHDDMDLSFGKIRVKVGGGSGGHKGVENVRSILGSADFKRLRIGIDKPSGEDAAEYVLSEFASDETVILENEILPRAVEAAIALLTLGAEAAMNAYNG